MSSHPATKRSVTSSSSLGSCESTKSSPPLGIATRPMAPAVCEMDERCVHRTMSREITFVGGPRDGESSSLSSGEPPPWSS